MFRPLKTKCLLLGIVVLVNADTKHFNPQLFCTYIANDTKIKDPSACNRYITCVDQKPITGACKDDLFYDRNTRSCVAPNTIPCYSSNPCAAEPNVNDFMPDPYSCNKYYYCQNGKGSQGFCPSGMNFNPSTKNCIRNYPCEVKILPDDYCNIVPDDVFIKVPNSCASYQVCWHGKLISGSCPNTFYFNAFWGACDYSANVDCEDTAITVGLKCNQPGVFISDAVTCNGYFYCQEHKDGSIQLIPGECPVFRFFDPSNGGTCVSRSSVSCPYNRCAALGYSSIQLANINDDGCTGFLICQDGEIIGKSDCPSGQYFNEWLQLCTTQVVKYPACVHVNKSLRVR